MGLSAVKVIKQMGLHRMDQMRFKPANAEKVSKAILDTGLQALVDERVVYELVRPDGKKKRFIEGIGG